MGKKTKQTAGDVLLEMEICVRKLVHDHGFQWGDVLFNQYGYLMVHCPEAQEEYTDGTRPIFFYGPQPEHTELQGTPNEDNADD